jgi:hypothetical protein
MRHVLLATAAAIGLALAAPAQAGTITFDGLAGANLSAFPAAYVEDGFTVTPTSGSWFQGQGFGNPLPSAVLGPVGDIEDGSLTITGGLFSFVSVDGVSSNNLTTTTVQMQGLRDGVEVFWVSTFLEANDPFATLEAPFANVIDTLVLTVLPGFVASSVNLDNIVLTPFEPTGVPLPASAALLGAGLLGLGLARRRARG